MALVINIVCLLSCNDTTKSTDDAQKEETTHVEEAVTNTDCSDVHWSHHKGADGPANWINLCTGYSSCGGVAQSPINIVTEDVVQGAQLAPIELDYAAASADIINNGHTVEFRVAEGSSVNLDSKDYQLLQFHYHAQSEHTIDGKHAPMEVHFVHQHSDTDYAVLGVLLEEGIENALFTTYLDQFPASGQEYQSAETFDLMGLFPEDKSYFNYKGSLTTPPCSEVVNWYVLQTPISASKEQLDQFATILGHNYRPVKELNDRVVQAFE